MIRIMQSGAANMGEDGNYFSDFHRKLAEINFNWGISSMHKYRGNLHTSPDLPLMMVLKLELTFGPSVSMLSSLLQAGPGPSSISIPGILATTHIYSDRLKPNRLPNGLFCSCSHAISECIM